MKLEDRIAPSDEVVSREVGGEIVLLDLEKGLYFGLDPVGTTVWERLVHSPSTIAELCDVVEEEYEATRDRIEADLLALAADLMEKNLILKVG